jgi:hypothetical protein
VAASGFLGGGGRGGPLIIFARLVMRGVLFSLSDSTALFDLRIASNIVYYLYDGVIIEVMLFFRSNRI